MKDEMGEPVAGGDGEGHAAPQLTLCGCESAVGQPVGLPRHR